MESNAHFVIGVSLRDAHAGPLELPFQQELHGNKRIMVRAPRQLFYYWSAVRESLRKA